MSGPVKQQSLSKAGAKTCSNIPRHNQTNTHTCKQTNKRAIHCPESSFIKPLKCDHSFYFLIFKGNPNGLFTT